MKSELYKKPTTREIIAAVDDWMLDRSPEDPAEIELAKIWLRLNRKQIKVCPECDGDCGESCAVSAEQHWAALCNPKPRKKPPGELP